MGNQKIILSLVAQASLLASPAWAVLNVNLSHQGQMECQPTPSNYPPLAPSQPYDMGAWSNCKNQCAATVQQEISQAQGRITDAKREDLAISSSTTGAAQNIASKTKANNTHTMTSSGSGYDAGRAGKGRQTDIAKTLAAELRSCSSKINSSCGSSAKGTDEQAAKEAASACDSAAAQAEASAAQNASTGSGMGDLSSALGPLAQAMGPLAQMMNQKEDGQTAATAKPGASSISDLGTKGITGSSATVGKPTSDVNAARGSTYSSPSASRSFSPEGSSYTSATGSKANSPGVEAGKTTASAGGGSSGALNSSGASKMPEGEEAAKAAAAAAAAAGEDAYGAGGGGYSKPMLGLKGKMNDLDSFVDPLASAKAEGTSELADRSLASVGETQAESDVGGQEVNIFHLVHSKIKEMKKRGSI